MKYLALAAVFAAQWPATSYATSHHGISPVIFSNGTATILGSIKGYEYGDYRFSVGADESLRAELKTNNTANYFNLLRPAETGTAFFNGSVISNTYLGEARSSSDYTARVYLMRSAAHMGARCNYRGVTIKEANEIVAIHQSPSANNASVLLETRQGALLYNLGCTNMLGKRWCKVKALDGSVKRAWVSGSKLYAAGYQPIR